MSCVRPPNFLLRKQKSLVCESVCQSTAINTRERRLRLSKQFSVDQSRDVVNSHRSINASNQLKNGNVVNNSWGGNSSSPDASLRIFTAIKTKSQQNHGCEPNDECVFYSFWFDLIWYWFIGFCAFCHNCIQTNDRIYVNGSGWMFSVRIMLKFINDFFVGTIIIHLINVVMQLTTITFKRMHIAQTHPCTPLVISAFYNRTIDFVVPKRACIKLYNWFTLCANCVLRLSSIQQ